MNPAQAPLRSKAAAAARAFGKLGGPRPRGFPHLTAAHSHCQESRPRPLGEAPPA